jgi:GST-like protein
VDSETGISVFESGAILMYLAEKSGKLLPTEARARYEVVSWLMFQMSGVGPMFGQLGFFRRAKEPVPAALARYQTEVQRILGVLDKRLGEHTYLAREYSIADIATYPWVSALSFLGLSADDYPHLGRWIELLKSRPAVQKGMQIPA